MAWLVDQQLADGGFPDSTGNSKLEMTADAVLAGYALTRMSYSQVLAKARDYLLAKRVEFLSVSPGLAAKLVMAFIVLDKDLEAFLGVEDYLTISDPECVVVDWFTSAHMVAPISSSVATSSEGVVPGGNGYTLRDHALILAAYGATGDGVPETALELLGNAQSSDGGWAIDGSTEPGAADAITTALVIQGLAIADHWRSPAIRRGLRFLRSLRTPEGGFAAGNANPLVADAASTALAIQAMRAADQDSALPESEVAPQVLAQFQMPSGGFRSLMTDEEPDLPATLQAILAMEERYLPVRFACAF